MRVVVTFLLFLCFSLVSKFNSAYATLHTCNEVSSPAGKIQKALQVENLAINCKAELSESGSLAELTSYPDGFDDDNEEDFIRKHVLSAKYFVAFYYAFIKLHPDSRLATDLLCCSHPIYTTAAKYIKLGVLRI